MSNIYSPPVTLHQIVLDATRFLSHLTPELFLIALIVLSCAVYFINREKTALCVALAGALYLLPFLLSGHLF